MILTFFCHSHHRPQDVVALDMSDVGMMGWDWAMKWWIYNEWQNVYLGLFDFGHSMEEAIPRDLNPKYSM